ncbi:DUF1294 domain-containing protein [uncultured Pseudoflavonifractor sp.]|uniref:DUF1294 domain-containing protein n=1 Tax=uncultured Pseudoflavonifractor sp. TaxID=1221379 RepID=UPI0025FD8AA0|nr:DUF1294 domain-containing protein [uncultured Pseudoflavonifractor sp.]
MREFLLRFWPWIGGWAGIMSLLDFCLMGFDKRRARRDGWRVRECTFFIVALLGGALGGVIGMFFFRHKTRHWYFRYGLPAILILQLVLVAWGLLSGGAS